MTPLRDLLLTTPVSDSTLEFLLFATFALHLLFVLLMLGTAMIALFFFVHAWVADHGFELRWDRRVLRTHLAFKSLAVVLGVAPILVIQVLWSVPFLTAASLVAPYWLAITPLLIVAFVLLDVLGHKLTVHPIAHLVLGVTGLAALLAVPLVFTGVVTVLEHPQRWATIAESGLGAHTGLVAHWTLRYLHVLGAAAVFGGAFHFYFSTDGFRDRDLHLSHWMVIASLFQVVVGVLLLATLEGRLSTAVMAALGVGVAATVLLVGLAFYRRAADGSARVRSVLALLPVVLVAMLLARQMLQHDRVAPLQEALEVRAEAARAALTPLDPGIVRDFEAQLAVVYDDGPTIYENACAFCHGMAGDGRGPDAHGLIVPPERLTAVRADRAYVHERLVAGVPGSAMPYFTIYDREKLARVVDHLADTFGSIGRPAAAPVPGDADAAAAVFERTCATCHGADGAGSEFGRSLQPPPPDFRRYGLAPERAFAVITEGYTGTVMQPFDHLEADVRWGLVEVVRALRTGADQTSAVPPH